MTELVDIRERLGSLSAQIGELRDGQQEIVGRLGAVEVGLAEQRVSVDRLRADIKRLERRFDAADAFGKTPSWPGTRSEDRGAAPDPGKGLGPLQP